MSYLDLASVLVCRLEACKLLGYPDVKGAPTIGYGHAGPEVKIGETISREIADRYLAMDLGIADQRLSSVCYPSSLGKLADHQRAALISFVFNVGAEKPWMIWKDVNACNFADVPAQLRRFDKATIDGKLVTVPGLSNRREAEIAFWNTADVEIATAVSARSINVTPPSHTTVAMITPPTPEPAPPMAKVSLVAKATTAIGGMAVAAGSSAQQIHGIVSPYVNSAKIFNTLDTVAVGGIIAAGVVGVLIHAHQAAARQV